MKGNQGLSRIHYKIYLHIHVVGQNMTKTPNVYPWQCKLATIIAKALAYVLVTIQNTKIYFLNDSHGQLCYSPCQPSTLDVGTGVCCIIIRNTGT